MALPTQGFRQFDTGIPRTQGYVASRLDPQQQSLYSSMFEGLDGFNPTRQLTQMAQGDDSYYAPMEAQAMRSFRQKVVPSIASQFVGRLGGSAAQGAFAQAGANLSEDLFAQRQQMRQNALRDLLGLEQSLLGRDTYERSIFKKPSTWDKLAPLLGGIAKGVGAAAGGGLGFLAGGPSGAAAGSALGNSLVDTFTTDTIPKGSMGNYNPYTGEMRGY